MLECSKGHIYDPANLQDRLALGNRVAGDRCPMLVEYNRITGGKYCRRILKTKVMEAAKTEFYLKIKIDGKYRFFKGVPIFRGPEVLTATLEDTVMFATRKEAEVTAERAVRKLEIQARIIE